MAETIPPGSVLVSTDITLATQAVLSSSIVSVDTETTEVNYHTAHLVGVSLYPVGSDTGYYLPVYSIVDPQSALIPFADVIQLVTTLLTDPNRVIIFHNAVFDLLILLKYGVVCYSRVYDTQYAEHRLDNTYRGETKNAKFKGVYLNGEQLNYKLKTLTRVFFGVDQITFEDATGGLPMHMVPIAQTAPYAVGDTYWTARHYSRQLARLQKTANAGILNVLEQFDFPVLSLIAQMLLPGIDINQQLATEKIAFFQEQFNRRSTQIWELLGKSPNITTKSVLRSILKYDFQLPVNDWTSLSSVGLTKLAIEVNPAKYPSQSSERRAKTFIKLVLSRRRSAQLISKFFVPLSKRIDPATGRLYVGDFHSMNETGRFAASNPNIQALDKGSSVRQIIVAEPGRMIVAADFKNIEPRCLAQALLMFIQGQGEQLAAIKQQNRVRAHAQFNHLLHNRQFLRPYKPPVPLPYPQQSLLANFFTTPGAPQDPYAFIAQHAFGIANPTPTQRARMKTITLALIFGKGVNTLARELELSYAETVQALNQFAAVMPELGSPTFELKHGEWVKSKPTMQTYKEDIWEMARHSGEVTSLFGRKRRFPGLFHLRKTDRCRIITRERNCEYVWDVAPIQMWNYVLHVYVYRVWHAETGTLIGDEHHRGPFQILHKPGRLVAWPFHQISYRTIRRIESGPHLVHFMPVEDVQRIGFNAVIQATASDILKQAILNVQPVMQQFDARMLMNVHDELVFSVPGDVVPQFVPALRAAMTQPPATWWTIPIGVDIEVGPNYGQLT
jgi:DNA polymerase I-like protein with 3'-5' exonuclease and polymerase domains